MNANAALMSGQDPATAAMYAGGLIPATNMQGALGRPSSSETNIHRMLQMSKPHRELPMARPGSALAMLQGKGIIQQHF